MRIPEQKDKCLQKIILDESLRITAPSSWLKGEIIEANTFENPKYQEAVKYHRYTNDIPPHLETYILEGDDLIIKRGFTRDLINLLKQNDVEFNLEDERSFPPCSYQSLSGISLRPYQQKAVDDAAKKFQGVIVAPTGAGKTIMGLELIRRQQTTALIITHKKELLEQWEKEIKRLFGFAPGVIGCGRFEIGDKITIAMSQTLAKRETQCKEIAHGWGLLLVDEVHHAPADQFSTIIDWIPAKFRYGLSATPTRRDRLDCLIFRSIGPIIAKVSKHEVESVGAVVSAKVNVVQTHFDPGEVEGWHEYLEAINSAERNMLVINLIPKNKSVLILVDRVAHAENISAILCTLKVDHILAHGSLPPEERTSLMQRIKNSSVTIGTTGLLGEGLDVAHWDTLILASPISSEIKLLQAIGRVVRPAKNKEIAVVYDLHDDSGLSGYSLKKRLEIYKKHRIKFEFNADLENDA